MGTDRCQTAIIMDGVICEECGFLSTWIEIPEVCLGGLYKDYRSPTYNQERGYFEPGYVENIAKHIGGPSEALNRVAALDDYFQRLQLKGLFSQESILLALDWGGADGRFMPTLNKTTKKFVYEISDKPSIDNVIKKTELCNDDRFDIIVVAHVLEHVSNPNDFLGTAVNHIADGGYLYLEVPLEVKNPETIVEDAKSGRVPYEVHEHINKYTLKSLQYLALSHGLKIIDLTTEEIDFGWTKASVIRLLAHKCSNFHDES